MRNFTRHIRKIVLLSSARLPALDPGPNLPNADHQYLPVFLGYFFPLIISLPR